MDLTKRTNVLYLLVSLFFICIAMYAVTIPFVVYSALDGFLLKTVESLIGGIFLVINISTTTTVTTTDAKETKLEDATSKSVETKV